jgi:hypothetical protein
MATKIKQQVFITEMREIRDDVADTDRLEGKSLSLGRVFRWLLDAGEYRALCEAKDERLPITIEITVPQPPTITEAFEALELDAGQGWGTVEAWQAGRDAIKRGKV